jgi:alpha-glucosidase
MSESLSSLSWWQKAVFYQIYPRSFADGNDDGISDFPGMTQKLDYLQDLGIDAVWFSPHFPSPFLDCGYDIADYCGVAPEHGTLQDFKQFLAEAHRRGIRVILDLVLNHSSDQHPWFLASRSSRQDPKRDWYIWKDGPPENPPNNWNSVFSGSAWEYDEHTQQSYYHMFLKEQPDLNWRNPEVKAAMWQAVRFWLDLGIDGYRLDAIGTIYERQDLRDHPVGLTLQELSYAAAEDVRPEKQREFWRQFRQMFQYQRNQPGVHELMQELRLLTDEYAGERVLVGEADEIAYYGDGDNELHMVFNFPLMRTRHLAPSHIRKNQQVRLAALPQGAWACNTLGNHDSSRLISRYGDGAHDAQIARLGLALMLTLRGTPFLYNGEEIGMTDYYLTDINQVRDMMVRSRYEHDVRVRGLSPQAAMLKAGKNSRDRCRTPMQWTNAPNAGFCSAHVPPWLPVNPNYAQGVNVAEQTDDPDSLLNFYRRMLALRRTCPALIAGDYTPLHPLSRSYLAFTRNSPQDGQNCLVVLNYSDRTLNLSFDLAQSQARLLFSSRVRPELIESPFDIKLAPFEVYIAELV